MNDEVIWSDVPGEEVDLSEVSDDHLKSMTVLLKRKQREDTMNSYKLRKEGKPNGDLTLLIKKRTAQIHLFEETLKSRGKK